MIEMIKVILAMLFKHFSTKLFRNHHVILFIFQDANMAPQVQYVSMIA